MSKCIACKCDNIEPGKHNCLTLLDANEALIKGSAVELKIADVCDLPELSSDALYNVSCVIDNIIKQICWLNQNAGQNIDTSTLASKSDNEALKKLVNDLQASVNDLKKKPDKDTVYNDTEVKNRLVALEGKSDKFVKSVTSGRSGNKVTLTYTMSDNSQHSVTFDDKDTIGIAYDDSAIRNRLTALESRPDKDTKYTAGNGISISTSGVISSTFTPTTAYNDTEVKNRLSALEARPDKDTKYTAGKGISISPTGEISSTFTPTTAYDDTNLRNRVDALEKKPDKDTVYNDTDIKRRLTALEGKGDNDTKYTAGFGVEINGNNQISIAPSFADNINKSITAINSKLGALDKIIANLTASGAWANNDFVPNRNIATGNINLFGGTVDGNYFIRTNKGSTENDLAGGV